MYQFLYLIKIPMMFTDVSSDFITDPPFVAWYYCATGIRVGKILHENIVMILTVEN